MRNQKNQHESIQQGGGPPQQKRIYKNCETFLLQLRRNNPELFQQFCQMTYQYRRPNQINEYYQGMVQMFQEQGEIVQEINKLLHVDARIQSQHDQDTSTQNLQVKFQECCELIKKKSPQNLVEFIKVLESCRHGSITALLEASKTIFAAQPEFYEEISKLLSPIINDPQEDSKSSNNQIVNNSINNNFLGQQDPNATGLGGAGLGFIGGLINQKGQGNIAVLNAGQSINTGAAGGLSRKQHQSIQAQGSQQINLQQQGHGQQVQGQGNQRQQKNKRSGANNSTHGFYQSSINIQYQQQAGPISSRQHHKMGISNLSGNQQQQLIHGQYNQQQIQGNIYINNPQIVQTDFCLGDQQNPLKDSQQQQYIMNHHATQSYRNDQAFFAEISKHILKDHTKDFYRLLHLYTECIIPINEMLNMIQPVFLQGQPKSDLYFESLKDILESREGSRRKQTLFFKPLNDIDFSRTVRTTHSYVKMPNGYPIYCSLVDDIGRSVLNRDVVTVPHGSEHQSFIVMRKNQYEDALFKSEDEKYEFDLNLMHFKRVIQLLIKAQSLLTNKINQLQQNPQNQQKSVQQEVLALIDKALQFKVIHNLYKNGSREHQEIIDLLHENPQLEGLAVVLGRVQDKYQEIIVARNTSAQKLWHEVAEKNFHRSLDHRSFYFKKHDRKITSTVRFEKEPEFRTHIINNDLPKDFENKEDFETDKTKFFRYLNTFEGLTNIERCDHSKHEKYLLEYDDLMNQRQQLDKRHHSSCLPIMTLIFENRQICEDAYSLICHYISYYGTNQNERQKIRKAAKIVLTDILHLNPHDIDVNDQIYCSENKIIQVVQRIEQTIFDKIYSYLNPVQEQPIHQLQQIQEEVEENVDDQRSQNIKKKNNLPKSTKTIRNQNQADLQEEEGDQEQEDDVEEDNNEQEEIDDQQFNKEEYEDVQQSLSQNQQLKVEEDTKNKKIQTNKTQKKNTNMNNQQENSRGVDQIKDEDFVDIEENFDNNNNEEEDITPSNTAHNSTKAVNKNTKSMNKSQFAQKKITVQQQTYEDEDEQAVQKEKEGAKIKKQRGSSDEMQQNQMEEEDEEGEEEEKELEKPTKGNNKRSTRSQQQQKKTQNNSSNINNNDNEDNPDDNEDDDQEQVDDDQEPQQKKQIGQRKGQKQINVNVVQQIEQQDNIIPTQIKKEAKWKTMGYLETDISQCHQFLPYHNQPMPGQDETVETLNEEQQIQQNQDNLIFYGTKQLYIFLRFFYTLFERFYKAYEISSTFENNEKSANLSPEDKIHLANERYEIFKIIVINSLKQRDMTKTEDYLRSIFGRQAFLLFTIDKLLSMLCRSLQQLANDELTMLLLQDALAHSNQKDINDNTIQAKIDIKKQVEDIDQDAISNRQPIIINEQNNNNNNINLEFDNQMINQDQIKYARANRMALDYTNQTQDRNMYRFFLQRKNCIIYINYFDSLYKNWESSPLNSTSYYFNNYVTLPEDCQIKYSLTPIFLKRNLIKQQKIVQSQKLSSFIHFQQNNIEFFCYPNAQKLCTMKQDREDIFISKSKASRSQKQLKNQIRIEYSKVYKFTIWIDKITYQNLKQQK